MDDDAKRLPAVRFVSPRIEKDVKDGTGKVWPGLSITHLAVTDRPVQTPQQPFKPVSLAFDLSLDGWSLSEEDPAKTDPPGDGNEEPDEKGKEKEPPENEEEDDKIPDKGSMEGVIKALSEEGYVLPSDTTGENFIERLYTALMTAKAVREKDKPAEEEEPYPGTEPPNEAQPPVSMSLDTPAAKRLHRPGPR